MNSDRSFIRRVCRRSQSGGQGTGTLSSTKISRPRGATETSPTRPESGQNSHQIRDLLRFCLPQRPRNIRVSDTAGDGRGRQQVIFKWVQQRVHVGHEDRCCCRVGGRRLSDV